MIYKIRKCLNKHPQIHQFLYDIYKYTILPFRNGHFYYNVYYLTNTKHKEIDKLKTYGFTEIQPYKKRDWRIGREKDGAFRRYYLGKYNGAIAFIKIGKNDLTVKNELHVMQKYYSILDGIAPKYILGDLFFDDNTVMLAVDFIIGLTNFSIPNDLIDFDNVCKQFYLILKKLHSANIIHADVHKANLMYCGNRLFLLDFGISYSTSMNNEVDYNARPGTYYIQEGNKRTYDDAFSFVKMVESNNCSFDPNKSEFYRLIKEQIGKRTFSVII